MPVTTRGRRIASIFLGAGLGTLITTFPVTVMISEGRAINNAMDLVYSSILCGACWLAGIVVFAFPIWLLIEKRRATMSWRTAAVAGLILSPAWFVIIMLLIPALVQESYTPAFWLGAMGFALVVGAIVVAAVGCVVALVMWRYAYRRAVTPDIAETFS